MKKKMAVLLAMLLTLSCLPAMAVTATPNQRLPFRTGPGTNYTELYTLPETTKLTALEFDSLNTIPWVLVEFTYRNQTVRAYTTLKRMSVNGTIPWAHHDNKSVRISRSDTVYSAPSLDSAYRSYLDAGTTVTLLRYDDDFAYVEFTDDKSGMPSRGWIDAGCVSGNTVTPIPGWGNSDRGSVNTREASSDFWTRYSGYQSITGSAWESGSRSNWNVGTRLCTAGTESYSVASAKGTVYGRAEASSSAKRLCSFSAGEMVSVVGQWKNWYLVWYDYDSVDGNNSLCAWVPVDALNSWYTSGHPYGSYLGTYTVVWCDSWVSLRAEPDSSSARLAKVPLWDDVEAYTYSDRWYECYYNGQWGYILAGYLTDRPGKFADYPY